RNASNNTYTYHYNLTDHLGNVRATLQRTGPTTGNVIQKHDYYPFGKAKAIVTSGINKYLYNGKEIQDEIGGQYDYGARFYDAEIARFNVIDRFAEKYYSMTPYQYGGLDPIKHIDVNGDSIWVAINTTSIDANGQSNTVTTRYYYGADKNGQYGFLDNNGAIYSGNDAFAGQLSKALGDLRSGGATGSGLVNDLMTSTNNVEIASRSRNSADENGTYILWNPTGTSGAPDQNGSNQRPSYIGLGHEMAHIQDVWNGTFNNKTWSTVSLPDGTSKNIKRAEIYATHMENRIRAENGLSLRVSYGIDGAGRADPSTRIIKSGTNQSLYFNSNGVTNYKRLGRKVSPFTY